MGSERRSLPPREMGKEEPPKLDARLVDDEMPRQQINLSSISNGQHLGLLLTQSSLSVKVADSVSFGEGTPIASLLLS
jgi:hypothetical protein